MDKSRQLTLCLVLFLIVVAPALDVLSALPPLAAGTFPTGTVVVPMDSRQNDRIAVYGFIHTFLSSRSDAEVARIIEPPDVTIQTTLTPTGAVFQGGPFLIDQRFLPTLNSLLSTSDFSKVTITSLTAPLTSNRIFFVRQPTRILVVKGAWGRTDLTLSRMRINYTAVDPEVVENNPSIIDQYSLIVVDCPGWFGGSGYSSERERKIQAIYDKIRARVLAGNEVIFTDIALEDMSAAFPGYVQVGAGYSGTWPATVYNPPSPAGTFESEFPSQYYNPGPNPNSVKIFTEGGGRVVSGVDPSHASDVRIVIDSDSFGVPSRYAILGMYFQFGNGIVEALAFHPQQQLSPPVDLNGYYAVYEIYGNKFVHGPQSDFFLTASPPSASISQGDVATYTITVTSVGSFSSPVALQVTGMPQGSTVSFAPSTVTPSVGGSATSTLTISTAFSTSSGNYTLNVSGSSTLPAITRSVNVALTVKLTAPDFLIDTSPKLLILNQSQCRNASVSIRAIGTFNSPANLNLTGVPARVTFRYIPNPATPPIGGTVISTLTICAESDAAPGNYTLTIIGTGPSAGGQITHTTNMTLRILTPGGPNLLVYLLVLLLLFMALGLALLAAALSRGHGRGPRPTTVVPRGLIRRRPRVQYVLPLPTVRCRHCGRIMPLHAVYCPYCGRPQVVLVRPQPRMLGRPGVRRVTGRGVVAFGLSLVAGILVILNSGAILVPSFWGPPINWSTIFWWLPNIGQGYAFALGFIIGLILIMGSLIMILGHGALADVIIFPFAVFSLIIGGGFVAGLVLGIIGGILGVLRR